MQTELDPWRDPFQRIEESEERERRTRIVGRPHQRSLSLFFNPWFLLLARLTSDSTTPSNEPNRRGSFSSMNSFSLLFKTPLYDIRLTCEKKLHQNPIIATSKHNSSTVHFQKKDVSSSHDQSHSIDPAIVKSSFRNTIR